MKLAIVGSRGFNDYQLLKTIVDSIVSKEGNPIDTIISGGAQGADFYGRRYANEHHIVLIEHLPDWGTYGRLAGIKRNRLIIQDCDVCIAFWDGTSHGTRNDIELCGELHKKCYIYNYKLETLRVLETPTLF